MTKTEADITDIQLRFRVTGDDGRCSRSCETCGGNGRVEMLEHCPDCKGDGVIWNEGRVANAVRDYDDKNGLVWASGWSSSHVDGIVLEKWDNRHDKDWQASLETHVGGYIEPAPDYRSDVEALKAALRAGEWSYTECYSAYFDEERFNAEVSHEELCPHGAEANADDPAEALCAATIAAVRGEA